MAAHPRQPQTAWFVPAIKAEVRMPRDGALCVTRTDDGGQSWEIMRHGLPQRNAYDLICRPGLDVDGAGEWLRWARPPARYGPATTAGEAGRSAHLPPIYAVRFV